MRRSLSTCGIGVGLAVWAAPAHAAAMELPDPANISLFALGLAGLVVGRWFAGKKPRD